MWEGLSLCRINHQNGEWGTVLFHLDLGGHILGPEQRMYLGLETSASYQGVGYRSATTRTCKGLKGLS